MVALFWEPKWVRKKIYYEGIEIVTCQDKVTKSYLCPICVDIDEVCPEGKETNVLDENMLTFFTLEDLIRHMRTHAIHKKIKRIIVKKEE